MNERQKNEASTLPARLFRLWKYRKIKLLNLYNALRFQRAARKRNADIIVGRGLRLDRRLALRLEGSRCRLRLGSGVQSDGAGVIVIGMNGSLTIGDNVYLNSGVMISCLGDIQIGENTLIGPQVNIFDNNHRFGRDGVSRECVPGVVTVGRNCWIAANVILLDGAQIGDNCVIGAGCVIKGVVPAGTIVTAHQEQHMRAIE